MEKNIHKDISLYFLFKDIFSIKYYISFFALVFFLISFLFLNDREERPSKKITFIQPSYQFSLGQIEYVNRIVFTNDELLKIIFDIGVEEKWDLNDILEKYYQDLQFNIDEEKFIQILYNVFVNLSQKDTFNDHSLDIKINKNDPYGDTNSEITIKSEISIQHLDMFEIDNFIKTSLKEYQNKLIDELSNIKNNIIFLKKVSLDNLKAEESLLLESIINHKNAKISKLNSYFDQVQGLDIDLGLETENQINQSLEKIASSDETSKDIVGIQTDIILYERLISVVTDLFGPDLSILKGQPYIESRIKYINKLTPRQYAFEEGMTDLFSRLNEIKLQIDYLNQDNTEIKIDKFIESKKMLISDFSNYITIRDQQITEIENNNMIIIFPIIGAIIGLIIGFLVLRFRKEKKLINNL